MIELYDELKKVDAAVVLVVHDEVVVELSELQSDGVAILAKSIMERAAMSVLPQVQFVVDVRVAKTLGSE